MTSHAFLTDKEPKVDGRWFRKVVFVTEGDDDGLRSLIIDVGGPDGENLNLLDDLAVAKKVVKALGEAGWQVVPSDLMPFSSFTPEEASVLSGSFEIERLENEHS